MPEFFLGVKIEGIIIIIIIIININNLSGCSN